MKSRLSEFTPPTLAARTPDAETTNNTGKNMCAVLCCQDNPNIHYLFSPPDSAPGAFFSLFSIVYPLQKFIQNQVYIILASLIKMYPS